MMHGQAEPDAAAWPLLFAFGVFFLFALLGLAGSTALWLRRKWRTSRTLRSLGKTGKG
ncbi:hypothetical protein LCGC14_1415440 [marine sediment metagenome]|uniref:Uncharacterized protein n=1 Tax=marine sediment metagenome TaxID=412755 RepID=A0A0F9JTD2_9ZZZZ